MLLRKEGGQQNMVKDTGWKGFLSDDARYADVINGVACGGEQVVKKEDLQEKDKRQRYEKKQEKNTKD